MIYVAKFVGDRYKDDAASYDQRANSRHKWHRLEDYYKRAYKAICYTGNSCIISIMPLLYKQTLDNLVGFMEKQAYNNVWVERHPHFIWGQYTNPDEAAFEMWVRAQVDAMKMTKAGWTNWSWRIYGDENGFNGWSRRSVLRKAKIKNLIMG
ncbi:hypothetical protein Poli38472_012003 [Pythium oligandrum]|uniref:Uncharacterized protein n=1 Tax=Pythium oligandrum TaxID=41045 RepID=A0A8K1FPG3_PYTOL|nr:hypothetical protein Poli38472_012003 [Pythium oligandrum]|eukprot:TMW66887.1 hypothetical protein Poli38472_012003 [Pythium oligandrum]